MVTVHLARSYQVSSFIFVLAISIILDNFFVLLSFTGILVSCFGDVLVEH